MPPPPPPPALRAASLLISLQLLSRLATFFANQVIVRFLTADLLGLATQLEVYYLSVLFFARESLRVAVSRAPPLSRQSQGQGQVRERQNRQRLQSLVNLSFLPPLLAVPLAPLLGLAVLAALPTGALEQTPSLAPALRLYGLASVIELFSEPGFALAQAQLHFGVRARAEAAATTARCLTTLVCVVRAGGGGGAGDAGVLPFAAGQLAYSVVLLAVYAHHTHRPAAGGLPLPLPLLPRRIAPNDPDFVARGRLHRPTLSLVSSLTAQSVLKHFLTQGDTVIVSVLSTPAAQGVYALANNYGGLLARIVLQPVEECSRGHFGRLLSSEADAEPRDEPRDRLEDRLAAVAGASADLRALLRTYLLFSVPVVALGPLVASPLLALVAGSRWVAAGAGSALAAYCYYIPLLAVNGIAEAFVSAVATEAQVQAQSAWMVAFSIVFAVAGWVTLGVLGWGAEGLVVANSVNMACRIGWSGHFIYRYFGDRGVGFDLVSVLPSPAAVAAAAATPYLIRLAIDLEDGGGIVTLIKTAAASVPFLLVLAYSERRLLLQAYTAVRGYRAAATPQPEKDK